MVRRESVGVLSVIELSCICPMGVRKIPLLVFMCRRFLGGIFFSVETQKPIMQLKYRLAFQSFQRP